MGIIMPMSTTGRHNRITMTLSGRILDLLQKKEVYAMQEEGALVYWGSRKKNELAKLVDINAVSDKDKFAKVTINELEYVQPDFFLFKKNPYLHNARETKIAGFPDLIVEVWSDNNLEEEREFKLDLYASSGITEHWYIDQDSNEVTCYLGQNRLENQCLTKTLVTQGGLSFDLRYLAK
ncbi:MAG: Uma2 family endonuclease [Oscillospiraceae bacterium]|nr:Uma2 family endonuclease [Oscillospiraceae bacterium]MCL2158529.1 Uma2 family endonuclease [Oscillospiraceae bacterium]